MHIAVRKTSAIAVAALFAAGVAACSSSGSSSSAASGAPSSSVGSPSSSGTPASSAGPIKLGIDVSLTGGFAALGASTKNGIELATNAINAAGGVDGRQIQLTVLDDGSDAGTAVTNANKFIADGVDAVIGYNAAQTGAPAAAPLVRKNILNVALSGYLPGQPFGPTSFFAPPTFATHISALACYATKGAHAKNVAIIATNDAGGAAAATGLAAALKADNVSTTTQSVALGATDVTVAASKIRDAKPDLIFDDSVGPTGGLAAKTIRGLDATTPMYGWLAWEQAPVLNLYKSALNGVVMEGFISADDPTSYQKDFVTAWNKTYPSTPADAYGAWGYDSVEAVAQAFKAVPNATQSDGLTLSKALEAINYRGVVGDWKLGAFDAKNAETHTGMHLADVVWYTIQNGELKQLSNAPSCA